jgi:phage shock protein A
MGILRRVKELFLAETNGLIDKCEQPLNMVNQYMREFDQELAKGQKALANQLFIERRQAALIAETETQIEKRDRQSRLAVKQGEEQIAKLAIQEKLLEEKKLATYQSQYATIQEQTKVLEERIAQLLVQSEEFNHRRLVLASRAHVASSVKENVTKGFARAEEKIMLIEAELEAMQRFQSPVKRSAPQYLDPGLKDNIEKALEELKQQKED